MILILLLVISTFMSIDPTRAPPVINLLCIEVVDGTTGLGIPGTSVVVDATREFFTDEHGDVIVDALYEGTHWAATSPQGYLPRFGSGGGLISLVCYPVVTAINVSIVEVRALDAMDVLSAADFYAKVRIDGVNLPNSPISGNDDDTYPEWSLSRTVDCSGDRSIPVHIEIWESDSPLGDEHIDINANSGLLDLDLLYAPSTQDMSGSVEYGYSAGGGGDGKRAALWFHIGAASGDVDGDGLFDNWEAKGIHMNNDGAIDLDLPALGANPFVKDIFLEIDWMQSAAHTHRPLAGVVEAVIDAFWSAPVSNTYLIPGLLHGVRLHVDVGGNAIVGPLGSHRDTITFSDGGDFDVIKASNFDQSRRFAYHYCLFAHNILPQAQNSGWYSGIGELPGNDFVVSLGARASSTGTAQEQKGTLMHELGHNLKLDHGGQDATGYKPNYLSVMNYFFQFSGILPAGRLDYSRSSLPSLNENHLNEAVGIQDGSDNTRFYPPVGDPLVASGSGPINWDNDNPAAPDTDTAVDINRDQLLSVLNGYEDWSKLQYNSRATVYWEDGMHTTPESLNELDDITADAIGIREHDVEVFANVSRPVVHEGITVNLTTNIIVTNCGENNEILNLTLQTPNGTQELNQLFLLNYSSQFPAFHWSTAALPKGNYTITANVTVVENETDTADNVFICHFIVTIAGDVNGDHWVDIVDIVKIAAIFSSTIKDSAYSLESDINDDGAIDIVDVVICANHFGQKWQQE